MNKKVENLETVLTPTEEPTVIPKPTPTEEVKPKWPAGVSKDEQGMISAYDSGGNQVKIESNQDGTLKVYDIDGNLKEDMYDKVGRVIAYDGEKNKIRIERDETAALIVCDENGKFLCR